MIHSDRPIADATLPQTVTSTIPGIAFKRMSQFVDGTVQLDAKLTFAEALFRPNRYAEIKKLFDEVAHAAQDEVILQLGEQQ
jgi:hypothetical protein